MPKWTYTDNRIFYNRTGWCQIAAGPGYASAIVARHNADINTLTARAEAAEAERDDLLRQLEKIIASLKPTEREDRGREHSNAACDVYYLKDKLYSRAKALIEPKDPSNIEPTKEGL